MNQSEYEAFKAKIDRDNFRAAIIEKKYDRWTMADYCETDIETIERLATDFRCKTALTRNDRKSFEDYLPDDTPDVNLACEPVGEGETDDDGYKIPEDMPLENCPFCNSNDLRLTGTDGGAAAWVICNHCGAEGPMKQVKIEAIRSWNSATNNHCGAVWGEEEHDYPQKAEPNEYRYIQPGWLDEVARGLTAGAVEHPHETWRGIPAREHAWRAVRHLIMWLAGDRDDQHIINASMRCMMAFTTDNGGAADIDVGRKEEG